jgi:hypothetical protein
METAGRTGGPRETPYDLRRAAWATSLLELHKQSAYRLRSWMPAPVRITPMLYRDRIGDRDSKTYPVLYSAHV